MRNNNPHKIITFTGNDRVGKTTQIAILNEALNPSKTMKFPREDHWSGQKVRAVLKEGEEKEPYSFQYLNAINRMAVQAEIKEVLQTHHLLMDRYDVDTILYGFTEGVNLELCFELMKPHLESDLVLVFHGTGFGGKEAWKDQNDSNRTLQAGVVKTANAISSLYPNRFKMLNVDEYSSSYGMDHPINNIWMVHKRVINLITSALGLDIRPLEYVRVEEIVRSLGRT